jgi:V/A-type H+-transporting ATPase subunit A
MTVLQDEANLNEIVRLVGYDALSERDQLKLDIAKSLREDYLQQNAFSDTDSYSSLKKQCKLLEAVLFFGDEAARALNEGVYLKKMLGLPCREVIARAKHTPENKTQAFDEIRAQITAEIDALIKQEVSAHA